LKKPDTRFEPAPRLHKLAALLAGLILGTPSSGQAPGQALEIWLLEGTDCGTCELYQSFHDGYPTQLSGYNSEEMIMRVTKSSGNVFKDLGFESGEAENLRLRSELMLELETLIRDSGLTQTEAAEFLGIQQSRVSDLVRGKIDRFSIDTLVKLLAKAGRDVEIKVKRRAA
jgi:predicted XRE-type DNA-binding protein